MATRYPNAIDNDATIPSVNDNITEIGEASINGLKDAVIVLEKTVGTNPQGNTASLKARVNGVIDENGNIRASALSGTGFVTLPVTDAQVGASAGIKESKLDLDFSTADLKNSLNSVSATLSSVQSGLGAAGNSFNKHIYGVDYFHDGYDVLINGEGEAQVGVIGLAASTVGDAINELGTTLFGDGTKVAHVDLALDSDISHRAANVSVDSSGFEIMDRTSRTVQEALESLDSAQGSFVAGHLDTFHANGILREIRSGDLYNSNDIKVSSAVVSYLVEQSVVTLAGVSSFSALGVKTGDILVIEDTNALDAGSYQIRAVGPLLAAETLGGLPVLASSQLAVFHVFQETASTGTASVYGPETVSSQEAPLACAVRHNETIADAISILNPNAARVVSLGFNSAIINQNGFDLGVEVTLGDGYVRSITIPDLNKDGLLTTQASTVDAQSVANRINAFVSAPSLGHHFPITAFRVGNEIAIAHNLVGPEYQIRVLDGYTATYAMGFSEYGADVLGKWVKGNESNSYVVGGTERSTIKIAFTGTVTINTASSNLTIKDSTGTIINPLLYGIKAGSVMNVTNHPTIDVNGSYTIESVTNSSVSVFATNDLIPCVGASTTFNVSFDYSHVSLADLNNAETDQGIVQVAINSLGETQLHERLTYGHNLDASGVSVIDVSEELPAGTYTLAISFNGVEATFSLIDADALAGDTVTVNKYFTGSFKLYHSNNQQYVVIKVITTLNGIAGGVETLVVRDPVVYDESMVLCYAHFNGTYSVTNLYDARLFGNVSRDQIRDDFVEVYIQKPLDDLRSNGVVRGFDVLDLTFEDLESGNQALPLSGGVAYVGGVRVAVNTQKVVVQNYDANGNLLTNVERIIGINEFGTLQAFSDSLAEILTDGYESNSAFGKILPLYRVSLDGSGVIDTYTDLRLFINKLDNKVDFVVDESPRNAIGAFKSLYGALEYVRNYPSAEKSIIKVVGNVSSDQALIVPEGVSLVGQISNGGFGAQRVTNTGVQGSFVTLLGNNKVENLEFYCEDQTLYGAFVSVAGDNVEVSKCLFNFGYTITTEDANQAITAANSNYLNINNNTIRNCFSAIVISGGNNIKVQDNTIEGVMGISDTAYGVRYSSTQASDFITLSGNRVIIPTIANATDIRAISVDVAQDIRSLRIEGNTILCSSDELGIGIEVSNEASTSSVVNTAIITGNSIDGVLLDDNSVYGIYVKDCENLMISSNSMTNVGVAGNTTAGIYVGSGVLAADVTNNQILDCALAYGILIENTSAKVKVSGNSLVDLGIASYYIKGNATNSMVSDNHLVGPGSYGIYWSGAYSSISGNNLNRPGSGSPDYAFSLYGIYANALYLDVTGNKIAGMEYDEDSVGISNVSIANTNIKISDNYIHGDYMSKVIDLFGVGHQVTGNTLNNMSPPTTGDTNYIYLTSVQYSLIASNMLQGAGTYGFNSGTSTTTGVSIVNNDIQAALSAGTFNLYGASASSTAQCLIMGNRLKYGNTGIDVLGATPSSYTNTNTIGINPGLAVTKALSPASFVSGSNTASPDWTFDESGWAPSATSGDKYLFIPITDLNDGAQISSINVYGTRNNGTWVAKIYRCSVSSPYSYTEIGSSGSVTSLPITTSVTAGNGVGNATIEVVNNAENSYFIRVEISGNTASNYVLNAKVNFKY